MANDLAGLVVHAGQDPSLIKAVDSTPSPETPPAPKPPVGWDNKTPPSYRLAHEARK